MKYALILVLLASSALADEPTVALTRSEVEAYAAAVQAQTTAQIATQQAKPVLDKIRAAFSSEPQHLPGPPAQPSQDGKDSTVAPSK